MIPRRLVLADQIQRLRTDGGGNHFAHELRMGCRGGLRPPQANRLGGEAYVVVHIERTCLVMGIELVVAAGKLHRVVPAEANGELAPLVIGVERQQGVVQVEQGQPKARGLGIRH